MPDENKGFRFLAVDHIAIAVESLDPALKTFADDLGLPTGETHTLHDRGLKTAFLHTFEAQDKSAQASQTAAHLATRLELLAPIAPQDLDPQKKTPSEIDKFLQKRGPGLHHICLRVDDIQAAVGYFKRQGLKILGGRIQEGAGGHKVAFIAPKQTCGVLIELSEVVS